MVRMRLPPMLRVLVLPGEYAVAQLPAGSPPPRLPAEPAPGDAVALHSWTSTAEEVSLVCPAAEVPEGALADADWRVLKVEGPLELDLVGTLVSLLQPLMEADISVFTLATYNTDHVLVKQTQLRQAVTALRVAGHGVESVDRAAG
jgi:hypothetical protein